MERINIGDIISLNIKYENEEPESLVVQLVNHNPNIERKDVKEISVNSPVGSSILGKEAGDKCVILNGRVNIEIINVEKVKVKKI